MKMSFLFRLPLLLLLAGPLAAQNMKSLPIIVQKDRVYEGQLFGVQQDVWVYGTVKGDVGAVGADVHIFGNVEGNVSLINGTLALYRDAQISGNLVCLGGQLQRHEAAKVGGRAIQLFTPSPAKSQSAPFLRTSFDMALALLLYLLAIFTFYFFPNQVNEASFQLSQDWVRPLIVGTLVFTLFMVLLFFSILLMFVLIGLPLFLLVACGAFVISSFGCVIVLHRISDWIHTHLPAVRSLALSLFLSASLLILAVRIPYFGFLMAFLVLLWGTGIAIDTRFGTEKHWFTGRQRYW